MKVGFPETDAPNGAKPDFHIHVHLILTPFQACPFLSLRSLKTVRTRRVSLSALPAR